MPEYWMISNRAVKGTKLTGDRAKLAFYVSDDAKLDTLKNWRAVSANQFRAALRAAADRFPLIPEEKHQQQKHLTLFIHGYNNDWLDGIERYQTIHRDLYSGSESLGIPILFNWPSDGSKFGYYPDREDARASAPDLSAVFNGLYEVALEMQKSAAEGGKACKAKVSVIAHSMGAFVLQNALNFTWQRHNKPLLMSLINQCLMVAADVDNDLFRSGEAIGDGEGEGIANLCYRITALFTGRDDVLGMSAGLKHFGKRRLGRSGLDRTTALPDSVWDHDCSRLFPTKEGNIHSAYFWTKDTLELMRRILRGADRTVLEKEVGPA